MKKKISVAILGSSCDPPHAGHVAIMSLLLKHFDKVLLMPCYEHMYGKQMAPAKNRLEMCRIVAECDNRIKVSNYEIKNKLGGETYYLAKQLLSESGAKEKYDYYFAIGGDNAVSFDKWFEYKKLKKIARFVVIPRAGIELKSKGAWYCKHPHMLLIPEEPTPNVSSTSLRNALNLLSNYHYRSVNVSTDLCLTLASGYVKRYLNPDILEYIKNHNLYKKS
jgi:nicotinate (nicotinamide) nucleotide adenylyltransferase